MDNDFLKTYTDLVLCIEEVGGNSKAVLNNINTMTVTELLDTMSKNEISFHVTKEKKEKMRAPHQHTIDTL